VTIFKKPEVRQSILWFLSFCKRKNRRYHQVCYLYRVSSNSLYRKGEVFNFDYFQSSRSAVLFACTFLSYTSQHNNYQNFLHVACVKWVYWWYSLLHVSAHRAIIRQYKLIIISQTIELRPMWIHINIFIYIHINSIQFIDKYILYIFTLYAIQ
jgi:hypothetical protein